MGTRIAVMNEGRLQQVGTPQELYDRPINRFVAGFIGSPAMNFATVEVQGTGDGASSSAAEHHRSRAAAVPRVDRRARRDSSSSASGRSTSPSARARRRGHRQRQGRSRRVPRQRGADPRLRRRPRHRGHRGLGLSSPPRRHRVKVPSTGADPDTLAACSTADGRGVSRLRGRHWPRWSPIAMPIRRPNRPTVPRPDPPGDALLDELRAADRTWSNGWPSGGPSRAATVERATASCRTAAESSATSSSTPARSLWRLDADGRLLLVAQYRLPPAAPSWSSRPARSISTTAPSRTHFAAAHRELEEETGYRAGSMERIGGFWSAPGFSTEYLTLYLATDLRPADEGRLSPDEDEHPAAPATTVARRGSGRGSRGNRGRQIDCGHPHACPAVGDRGRLAWILAWSAGDPRRTASIFWRASR